MMEGEMEAGEIPSLLDQRIQTFKFDPTLSLTSKSPNDGQYGSFINHYDNSQAFTASTLPQTNSRRDHPPSPPTTNTHTSEISITNPALLQHLTRTQRPKPFHNIPRLLPKYVAPPPIDIVRILEEDVPVRLVTSETVADTMVKVDLPLPVPQSPHMSIQSIVTEMTHPLIPLLSPFPLEVLFRENVGGSHAAQSDSMDASRVNEIAGSEEMRSTSKRGSDEEPGAPNKRKKSDSATISEMLVNDYDAQLANATTNTDEAKKDGGQNFLVVSGGGTKITLKIPRKPQPAKDTEDGANSPVATEGKQPTIPAIADVKGEISKVARINVEKEPGIVKDYQKGDKDMEHKLDKDNNKQGKDSVRNLDSKDKVVKDSEKAKSDTNHKKTRDKPKDHTKANLTSPGKEKSSMLSKDTKIGQKSCAREKGSTRETEKYPIDNMRERKDKGKNNDGEQKSHGESKEKERVRSHRNITWTKLRADATNFKRIADEMAKDDSARADALDMYLNATIKFLECCSAREQEDSKGAPDLYKQCSAFFSTCAAICEKYKDNARASIQLKSAALASSRSFQLKRDRIHQQCEHMIQQLRHTPAPSQITANVPTPPAMPSPGLASTPPSPVHSSSDKAAPDQVKLISLLEDTKEVCSVFDTWARSEVLAQLEPLPNFAIIDIHQAIEYIKRQVQGLNPNS